MSEASTEHRPPAAVAAGRLALPGSGGRLLRRVVDAFLVAGLAVIAAVLVSQVVMRYVFHAALPWPEELAQFLLVAVSLLGAFRAFELDAHIRLDLPFNRSPGAIASIARLLGMAMMAGFAAYAGWGGAKLAMAAWNQPSTALRLPMGMIYLVVPLSCLAMLACLLRGLAGELDRLCAAIRTARLRRAPR